MNALYELFMKERNPHLSYSRYDRNAYTNSPNLLKWYKFGYFDGREFKPIDITEYYKLSVEERKAYAHGFLTGDTVSSKN